MIVFLLSLSTCKVTQLLHLPENKMSRVIVIIVFIVFAQISFGVHGSLRITHDEYPLKDYIKSISEEHFPVGKPLVVLPIGDDATNREVSYLLEAVHTSDRWPIVVFNARYEMEASMYFQTQKPGSYIILISGPCQEWETHISRFRQQLSGLSFGNTRQSWNPAAKFVVCVMSDCMQFDRSVHSRAFLHDLWFHGVTKAAVVFQKAQGTQLEIHTWRPYEGSQRCSPIEGTLPLNIFTAKNLSDLRRSGLFKEYFGKNFHQCPIRVHASVNPPMVNPPKKHGFNDSHSHNVYDGLEVELSKIIATSINMSLRIEDGKETKCNDTPYLYIGGYQMLPFLEAYKFTRSYLSVRYAWYTPCAVKCQRWNRFFYIFSVGLWISFSLSVVLAVIIVRFISKCAQETHLHEFQSYGNILGITAHIISVSLSVAVNRLPRSTPLRVFFLCWVCYSLAISTVFQAYLTTYIIEPGYEEPIKTVDQMIQSEKKFAFLEGYTIFYANSPEPVDFAILKDAARCPDTDTCFKWAAVFHNISTILHDFKTESYRQLGNWTDENNRPLLCELEDGLIRNLDFVVLVDEEHPLLEYINDVIGHIIEGGIFMQIKKRYSDRQKMELKYDPHTLEETYSAISVRHLQTVFCLLMLGYVLALACFVIEIMWHRYSSKRRETEGTSLSRADINRQLRSLSELNLRLYN